MNDISVDSGSLAGFRLDLEDLGANFSSNASRMLSSFSIPAGTTGLLATLVPSFETLNGTLSICHGQDVTALAAFGSGLATAGTQYLTSDTTTANAISAVSDGAAASASGDPGTVNRFAGLQLPTLTATDDAQFTIRQLVTSSIEALSPYDDKLSEAIGIKPAADYLTPLAADWEILQPLGNRICQLGINDFVSSQNLSGGLSWLQSTWSGTAAEAFASSATTLGQAMSTRSDDLDAVSKIIRNGGAYLERLVYNQTVGLSSALTQPMTFLDITLPLSHWALMINGPMRESFRTEIVAAVDAMKTSANTRRDAITTAVERISQAMDYSPGRASPTYSANDFEIPDKVAADVGVRRYGLDDNVWWETSIASA
ncbi:hypothetical protein [Nocardia neocaledoniensis]|uniref:hypothetical protein n=1 Tax=Nocardia neocaledoniensis TaxID=236511 RepID=UPI0024559712|nr:hypothetical protein [Nocardia neocaledoniensis]